MADKVFVIRSDTVRTIFPKGGGGKGSPAGCLSVIAVIFVCLLVWGLLANPTGVKEIAKVIYALLGLGLLVCIPLAILGFIVSLFKG